MKDAEAGVAGAPSRESTSVAAPVETARADRDHRLVMRDLMDLQLVTADGREIGRVDDVEGRIADDGSLVLSSILCGPQALAGRVSPRLRPVALRLFRGRFDGAIDFEEIAELGLTIHLRGRAVDYAVGRSDPWIVDHILRHIPWYDR